MAPVIPKMIHLVTVLTICIHGSALALHLEITPDTMHKLVKDEIQLTCTAKDAKVEAQKIMAIELGKDGQRPIAILDCDKTELEVDIGMRNRMQAAGHIDKNLTESYLRVTIQKQEMEDAGAYACQMFYLDGLGKMKQERASANLTIDNDNMTIVFVHLLNRVSDLETTNANMKGEIVQQQNTIKVQEEKLKFQEKMITEQNLSMTTYERLLKEQMDYIQNQDAMNSYNLAFSVGYDSYDKIYDGRTVLFSETILNIGNSYNNRTGIFTAPRNGLYVFHLTMATPSSNQVYVDLKANNKVVATLYMHEYNSWDQSSANTIVSLVAGDEVKPVVKDTNVNYLKDDDHYCVFSGYLLKAL